MGTTRVAIIVLSSVGSVLELVGIVMVAGRVTDLLGEVRRLPADLRSRTREGHRRVAETLPRPTRPFPPGLRRTVALRAAHAGTGVHVAARITVRRTIGGTVDERIQRLDDELLELRQRVDHLQTGLPGRIREGAKDPWLGLLLLFLGLACLLAAAVLGAS